MDSIEKRRRCKVCKICGAKLCTYNEDDVCFYHTDLPSEKIEFCKPTCCSSRVTEGFNRVTEEYNGYMPWYTR